MKSRVCRDAAAARDTDVKAAVARLAKLAAISEMQLETLQLQAEGNRIGQLGVSSGSIMGEFGIVHMFCSESHPCWLGVSSGSIMGGLSVVHMFCSESHPCWLGVSSDSIMGELSVVHMFCSESHPCWLASNDSPRLS